MTDVMKTRWIDILIWISFPLLLGGVGLAVLIHLLHSSAAAPIDHIRSAPPCVKHAIHQNARGERSTRPWTNHELEQIQSRCFFESPPPDPTETLRAQLSAAAESAHH